MIAVVSWIASIFRRTKPKCSGPIYFADQGIECCRTCEPHGCICCDHRGVDHTGAEYECFTDDSGVCYLRDHADRPCTKEPA